MRRLTRVKRDSCSGKSVAEHWDRNADTWTDHVRKGYDIYRTEFNNPLFFEFVGSLKGKDVLDAGCGEGYNTRLFAKMGARMIGIDISKKMIAYARREERRRPLGIRYEVTSYTDISAFGDESFDAVVSTMALMDGPDYKGAVKEFFRVLRPGGSLYFSITHPCFMTKGFGWSDDERGGLLKLTISDYFADEPYVERWRFSMAPVKEDVEPFTVVAYPRTLSEYLNALIKAGFVLRGIEEPRPSEATCKRHPKLRRWRDHAAIFLHVHASKP
jgi:ubiquinone/menaquinone biosynthesis C-methylase UbiE